MQSIYSDAAFAVSLAFTLAALLLCFIGVKFFRTMSTFMMFILVAIFLILIMKKASPGEVVTAFTLIGVLCAAITYRWYRLSLFIIAFFIGYSFSSPIFDAMWINIIIGALFGILANIYPVIVLIIISSVWGGLYFTIEGLSLLGLNAPAYLIIILCTLVIISGVVVQYFISKELLELPIAERRKEVVK